MHASSCLSPYLVGAWQNLFLACASAYPTSLSIFLKKSTDKYTFTHRHTQGVSNSQNYCNYDTKSRFIFWATNMSEKFRCKREESGLTKPFVFQVEMPVNQHSFNIEVLSTQLFILIAGTCN